MNHEYDLNLKRDNQIIVDLGANIGISALYFSMYYPGSTIYALEADEENYTVLKHNSKTKKNIIPLHKAIWKENATLFIEANSSHWARKVSQEKGEGGSVDGITLKRLMEEFSIDRINILKVDIEGSEIELFKNLAQEKGLLNKIDNIIVETHDWEQSGCSKAVFDCLRDVDYNLFIAGEKFFIRLI